MLYLFCYVLRVKSVVRASGEEQTTRQEAENGFDVQDFIQRMTLATGLDVKQTEKCRFSISHPSDTNADRSNSRCLKITEKISFHIASEASYLN